MGMTIEDVELWAKQNNFTIVADKQWEAAQDIICKYQQLQADYENRLNADMVAMLTEIQLEIEKQKRDELSYQHIWNHPLNVCISIIQQKIDALKEVEE